MIDYVDEIDFQIELKDIEDLVIELDQLERVKLLLNKGILFKKKIRLVVN